LRILDPACGTGNFLYVSMEELLRLEGKALALAESLGEKIAPAIHPNQFLGLELNPRAAVIAELVLWIGWLRHRLANHPDSIGDPVLPTLTNINGGTAQGKGGGFDAVLCRTATGEPDSENPMVPDWPEADFIVGNPPFIGGKDLRAKLGGDYAEALWKANPRVPKSADFVMQWWDHAAWLLTRPDTRLQRFGFVTTNSITQTFSRRVIEGYLIKSSPERGGGAGEARDGGGLPSDTSFKASSPLHHPADGPPPRSGEDLGLSLILAIPDHPWTKASKDAAAVRIAMTVAQAGEHEGRLVEIVGEQGLQTDDPSLEERAESGRINPDLSLGSDAGSVEPLMANEGLAYRGVQLIGAGFIVTASEAKHLGLGKRGGLEKHIRPYRNGRDLLQSNRDVMVIDLLGVDEIEVEERFPEVYQHLHHTVWDYEVKDEETGKISREGRKHNRRDSYKKYWWIHGEPRKDLRPALHGLTRYIATVETAKHRIFQFLDAEILPDNMLIAICSDDPYYLGVLSSSASLHWALEVGGTLEDRPRYNKSQIFDPFPFPDATPEQRAAISELAERLEKTRKAALAEVPGLTMTEIYNLREKLRSGAALSHADQDRATQARAGIVHRLHEQIDAAVAETYGWPADLSPSEIVTRLVTLNAERAKEEAEGHIRWLRPEYQIPRFGSAKPAKK
jgi:hypothetical protein